MSKDMLGVALCDARGPLADLNQKLSSKQGNMWLEEFKKFLRGKRCWSLLEAVGMVTIPATTSRFIAKDKFVINTSAAAPVQINHVGENFRRDFLSGEGTIEDPKGETTLRCDRLRQSSKDSFITTELADDKAETSLTELCILVEKQGRCQAGVLLTDGSANIFYIKNRTGVLRTVCVRWYVNGWDVGADSIGDPDRWGSGSQVFSRNSVLNPSAPVAA